MSKKVFMNPFRAAFYKLCISLMLFQVFNYLANQFVPLQLSPYQAVQGNGFLFGFFVFCSVVSIFLSATFLHAMWCWAEKEVKVHECRE